jgi:hypothetical protein
MTLREAVTQATAILGTVTVSGQPNIQKLSNVFGLLDAVDAKLAELEQKEQGGEESGTV